ncbi:MAG: hypothetical protein JO058_16120 [Alphaproteobacteria bacterium]|nr:hypothetical protein [Alphaproteobacteria bacterium]MBV9151296.1 hypothetical protein [Alphaproteobacteria bacterium]
MSLLSRLGWFRRPLLAASVLAAGLLATDGTIAAARAQYYAPYPYYAGYCSPYYPYAYGCPAYYGYGYGYPYSWGAWPVGFGIGFGFGGHPFFHHAGFFHGGFRGGGHHR